MSNVKAAFRRAAPGLYSVLYWKFGRYPTIARTIADRVRYTVASGPFRGMRYPSVSAAARVIPKLLGSYEEELAPVFEQIATQRWSTVVNVGSAEGYYAVGLALRLPDARVVAFDSNPEMREKCRELSRANGVIGRVDIRGACDRNSFQELPLAEALVVMDCEGYERELLLSVPLDLFRRTTIIVETHDFAFCGTTDALAERFRSTHAVVRIQSRERNPAQYSATAGLPPEVRSMAVDEERCVEGRRVVQEWLWLSPRS